MNGDISLSDKMGFGQKVYQLKLGESFTNNRKTSFHTLRYDFKPASVDCSKVATVDVGVNNQVAVTVPHLDGSGTTHTVFKGSQKPYQKECVLILDRTTGIITLERLASNLQVKKTRMEKLESSGPSQPSTPSVSQQNHQSLGPSIRPSSRPSTPVDIKNGNIGNNNTNNGVAKKRHTNKETSPKLSRLSAVPRHSPLQSSPRHRSKLSPSNHNGNSISNPAPSLPMIGLDMDLDNSSLSPKLPQPPPHLHPPPPTISLTPASDHPPSNNVGVLSESSSDSSSDSGSSSDSDSDEKNVVSAPSQNKHINGHINGTASPSLSMPDHLLLTDDLKLSESGSDSD